MPVKDPCKPFACRIQDCLKKHNYQESACLYVIEDMRECCRKWKEKSYVCHGMNYDNLSPNTQNATTATATS